MIRLLTNARSPLHRILFVLGFAVAIIGGLSAMHTLSAGDAPIDSSPTASAPHSQYPVAIGGAVGDAVHCAADCGTSGTLPDHSMLLMACALAALAVALVVFAPAQLARLSTSLGLKGFGRSAARLLLPARPPSLLVLSISRT